MCMDSPLLPTFLRLYRKTNFIWSYDLTHVESIHMFNHLSLRHLIIITAKFSLCSLPFYLCIFFWLRSYIKPSIIYWFFSFLELLGFGLIPARQAFLLLEPLCQPCLDLFWLSLYHTVHFSCHYELSLELTPLCF
jgi:hypothetical protein